MKAGKVGDLNLEANLRSQRKSWAVQGVAFVVFGLILIAGLLGLFGRGGFSHREQSNSDGSLSVEYERFLHMESPESLKFRVRDSGQNGSLKLWISSSYFESVMVQHIIPEPKSVHAEGNRFVFEFSAPEPKTSMLVKISLKPEKPGALSFLTGVGDHPPLSVNQFVYP